MAATTPPRTLACLLAPPNPDSVRLSRPGVDPLGRRATSPPSIFPSFQLLTNSLTKVARRLVGVHERSGLSLSCVRARAGAGASHDGAGDRDAAALKVAAVDARRLVARGLDDALGEGRGGGAGPATGAVDGGGAASAREGHCFGW